MFPLYMENKKHDNEHIFYHDPFAKTRAMPNAEKHDETCYAWSREKAWSRPKKKNLPLLTCFSFVLQRTRICIHPRVSLCPSVTVSPLFFSYQENAVSFLHTKLPGYSYSVFFILGKLDAEPRRLPSSWLALEMRKVWEQSCLLLEPLLLLEILPERLRIIYQRAVIELYFFFPWLSSLVPVQIALFTSPHPHSTLTPLPIPLNLFPRFCDFCGRKRKLPPCLYLWL